MISALASAMSGRKKVEPLLKWDISDQSDTNAMTLEAVLKSEIKGNDGDGL